MKPRGKLEITWYWVARFLCQVFTLMCFRFRVYGRRNIPATGGFILVANHQSFLDPIFCGVAATRPVTYVARDSLFTSPIFSGMIRSVRAIPISRDKADISTMKLVVARLKAGEGVCLYPEGTRTYDGRITSFKAGFGLLCRRSKSPVVPLLIDGAFECWPRQKKLFSTGPIQVRFGTPLAPEQARTMTNEELADWVTHTLRQMQHDARLQQGKQPYTYADESDSADSSDAE